jgi:hypothetical protein
MTGSIVTLVANRAVREELLVRTLRFCPLVSSRMGVETVVSADRQGVVEGLKELP